MDINLVSTNELIGELLSRYDNSIFCGVKKSVKEDEDYYDRHYLGDNEACIGLCDIVKSKILIDFEEEEGELDGKNCG